MELGELDTSLTSDLSNVLDFRSKIKYLIWLDGGHCGSAEAWITDEKIIKIIKDLNWFCFIYITPYQLKKMRHVEEYNKFIELNRKLDINMVNKCYYEQNSFFEYDTP